MQQRRQTGNQVHPTIRQKLATAQRAHKKKQVKRINRKIKNSRADATHKFTSKLVRENWLIVAGNVKSSSFTSGKLANTMPTGLPLTDNWNTNASTQVVSL